jgi:hypothetical protein
LTIGKTGNSRFRNPIPVSLYARWASKNIYRILTNLSIFVYLLIFIYVICCLISSNVLFIQPLAFCRNACIFFCKHPAYFSARLWVWLIILVQINLFTLLRGSCCDWKPTLYKYIVNILMATWNNQLYARRASKNIYRILTNLSIFVYLLIFIYVICCLISSNVLLYKYIVNILMEKL